MEKRLRIALVQPKFDESGGAERYASTLAKGLAARGNVVHLFGRKCNFSAKNIVFHKVPSLPFNRAMKTSSFNIFAGVRVNKAKFDVVQGFGKTVFQAIHRSGGGVHRAYAERVGKKSLSSYDRVVLKIEDKLFASPQLKAVVCPSKWISDEIVRFYPDAAEKIIAIPNGVDTLVFHPNYRMNDLEETIKNLSLETGTQILLFAASNFALKGLDNAIRALALLPDAVLCVAGQGNELPFRRLASDLGIANRVRFLGRSSNMAALYRSVDVLVHPTQWDIFANVCLEALACGTPVVTTEADGFADIADGKQCVEVLKKNPEPEAIAEAVNRLLLRGEEARDSAVNLAREHALERHVSTVETLYRNFCGATKS